MPAVKPSGEIRCCVDFKDIKKAWPKDSFSLLTLIWF